MVEHVLCNDSRDDTNIPQSTKHIQVKIGINRINLNDLYNEAYTVQTIRNEHLTIRK